jgi:histidinol phosphatase-like enzyme
MKVDKVGINVEYFKDKPFEVFQEAMKGKLRSDKIKPTYDSFSIYVSKKVAKPKKVEEDK